MKLAKTVFASALLTALSINVASAAPEKWDFDPTHTQIMFSINHFGYSNTLGWFGEFDGALMLDEEAPENSSVAMELDVASMDTGFALRNEHLMAEKWLNVANFPKITFTSTKVEQISDTEATLTGDMTLLGATHPITLDVKLNNLGDHPFKKDLRMVGFSATGTLKRSDFGFDTMVPNISDEIEVRIETELTKAK